MRDSLKYIQKKFPYFLNMSDGSNVSELTKLLDKHYIGINNGLELIYKGYFFLFKDLNDYWGFRYPVEMNKTFNEDNTFNLEFNAVTTNDDYINRVLLTDLVTGEQVIFSYDLEDKIKEFNKTLPNLEHDYCILMETWNEYSYKSFSNDINEDLDTISLLVGSKRRNYVDEV